ncbi:hypothetical protein AN2V17_35960 [Vallitalea sp. AN17-2]|uniref:Uncharacterized protein n=1 Tax=Vallitalea maricola TaxID=3074433 RepID=A0ACB5UP79_9FIRM|nr:hypothetical protein AN2V17_35960 [Vallitalea sp. AN17-2]
MLQYKLLILIGLFSLFCSITKPSFYWDSRKTLRFRKLVGDNVAFIIYLLTSLFVIGIGIYSLITGQKL